MKWLWLWWWCWAGSPLFAQENKEPKQQNPVQFQAAFSFGDQYGGPLVPVFIEGTNRSGQDLNLELRIESRINVQQNRPENVPAAIRRDTLAKGSTKRWFLYLSPKLQRPTPQSFNLKITDRDRVLYEQRLDWRGQERFQQQQYDEWGNILPAQRENLPVLVLSSFSRLANLLRNDAAVPGPYLSSIPSQLPDHWAAYAGFHAVLIHNFPLVELTTQQRDALLHWLRLGGTVIVSPGPDAEWLTSAPIREILRLEDVKKIQKLLPNVSKSPLPLYTFNSKNLKTLMQDKGHALISRANYGNGSVYLLSTEIASPSTDWSLTNALWTQTVRHAATQGDFKAISADQARVDSSILNRVLDIKLGIIVIPLTVFIVIYLAILGPVNFLVLRRKQRPALYFFTAPAIAVAFTVLLTAGAYAVRGTSTRVVVMNVIETVTDCPVGLERTNLALTSPGTGTLDIHFGPDGWVSSSPWYEPSPYNDPDGNYDYNRRYYGRYDPPQTKSGFPYLELGDGLTMKGFPVRKWEVANVNGLRTRDLGKGIRVTLEGNQRTITNGTKFKIVGGLQVQPVFKGMKSVSGTQVDHYIVTVVGAVSAGGSAEITAQKLEPRDYQNRNYRGEFDVLPKNSFEWQTMRQILSSHSDKLILEVEDPARPLKIDGQTVEPEKSVTFIVVDARN